MRGIHVYNVVELVEHRPLFMTSKTEVRHRFVTSCHALRDAIRFQLLHQDSQIA